MTQPQGSSGRVLADRYRLDSVLGSGGMGTVWRAEDEMLGRIVAVKELRMHGGVDDDERHRLIVRTLREAKATARIRHTAAVTVFDVVEEDDRPWIVMELVDGRSLAEVVKEDGPVTPARAAEIALELLGVLGAAHSQGILHRDVKPSNVLIGEDGRVVLTDFGIASVEGDTSVTSTGMLVGAPSYISPERARGQKPGPPADLWSLGGTLYAMLEGKPPYDRGSALATLTAVMTEELAVPESAGPLRPVIEGLLEKDPEKRLDASTTRSMLKRIVAEATARAESTTRVALPAADRTRLDLPRPGAGAELVGGTPVAAASEVGPADVRGDAAKRPRPPKQARPGVPGLSTVRVGSKLTPAAAEPAPAPAADPLLVETGTWSRSGTLGTAARWSRRRRRRLLAALVAVLLLVAGGIWLATGGAGGSSAKKGAAPAGTAGGGAAANPSGSAAGAVSAASADRAVPPPASSAAAAAPSSPPAGSAAPSSAAPSSPAPSAGSSGAAIPAGYHLYTDSSGFTIQLPDGLNLDAGSSKDGSHTLRGDGITLQIDWTTTPGASALTNWQIEEKQVSPSITAYQQLQLQAVTGWRFSNAADWEWTFGSGTRQHSLNRGFVTNDRKYGYALYWTANDSDWNSPAISQARDTGFQSFQPAP
ncbi:serine/threonine protein kinase [Kitasatospora sp. NBC_01287]|uniref:serine/threonine-protein kinase n=1 Tax=Kitasatospora sp. NBC_01287 TaxID=2903573 RepID=UPI00224CFA40|nr:serine/threonine-protein kinase [Kitasatospora sp. NBC_01287]MCX4748536.1 serine/threonine protein kinase [Kitasatospora sp. NBC_01287]